MRVSDEAKRLGSSVKDSTVTKRDASRMRVGRLVFGDSVKNHQRLIRYLRLMMMMIKAMPCQILLLKIPQGEPCDIVQSPSSTLTNIASYAIHV